MGIKMNTYAGGQITAGNDAILHDRAIANTGILHGCNITFMGANQIHIEKGYLLIKGRYCTVTEDTIQVAMSNSETELPGRLYVRADLADAQEPVKILSVAAEHLPELTQDENFNYDNGVWEMELATYTAGMTAIKDLTVTCEEVPEGASKKETAALLGKMDELTENLGDLTFAQDADGNWGYKVGGADPVIPFGGSLKPLVLKASQSYTADQSGYVLAFGAAANGNGSNLCSVTIKKNGNAVTPKFATANSLKLGAAWIPVDKGDVISIIPKGVNSNYQASMICFI
jgi:hypothetical protein